MAEIITRQELEDAKVDVATLETVVNGAADTPVTSRLGTTLKTVATVLNQVSAAIATVPTFSWLFASSTTMGNPSTGNVRFNNATLASVTAIAVAASSADTGNPDLSDLITKWDDSTSSLKGHLYIKKANTGTFAIFAITGAITDNTSWLQLPVTFVVSNGTFSASDSLLFYFVPKGDAGSISSVASDINMNGNQLQWSKGADVVAASALAILTDGNYYDVTGTTTITSINTTGAVGTLIKLHFDAILTLTHHATNLFLGNNGNNIITEVDDEAEFVEYDTGKWRCTAYRRASGLPVGGIAVLPIASGGTGQTTAVGAFNALKQSATTSTSGVVELATTSEVSSGSSGDVAPVNSMIFHAGMLKVWLNWTMSGGSQVILDSHNVSSITDNGVGDCTANFSTGFANSVYAHIGSSETGVSGYYNQSITFSDAAGGLFGKTSSSIRMKTQSSNGGRPDFENASLMCAGDY